jgi:hypothetical protein
MNATDEIPAQPGQTARPVRPPRRRLPCVLAGCGVLAVLLLACGGVISAGLYYAGAFGPRWQSFDVPDGGCRVEVPAAPAIQAAPAQPGVLNLTTYSARRLIPAQEFAVSFFDVHGEPGQQALDDGLTGMVRSLPGMIERARGPASVGGLSGKELVADGPAGTLVARIAPLGNRFYILLAVGQGITPDADEVLHFFDSFQVTDENRLAQARERREALERMQAEHKARLAKERREREERAEAARKDYEQFEMSRPLGRELPDGTNLVGVKMYLPFGPDAGAEVRNAVGGRLYGTIQAPARLGAGARGTGLHLPQAFSVYLPDTDGFRFGPDEAFSVAGWFRSRDGKGDVLRVGTGAVIGAPDPLVVELWQGLVRVTVWAPRPDPKIIFPAPVQYLSTPWPGGEAWHHFAVVRTPRGDGELVELYFDGRRVSQQLRARQTDLTAAKTLTLGGERHGFSSGPFRGAIDEIYTFSRALTGGEVRRLAASPAPSTPTPVARSAAELPGLVFHLPFDDADNARMTEAVSRQPVGQVKGAVDAIDGVRGGAARLTAASSGARRVALDLTEERAKFHFAEGAPFTLTAWVRVGEFAVLLDAPPLQLWVANSSVVASVGDKGPEVRAFRPPRDRWFHVALVREPGGKLRLHVDGVAAVLAADPVWPAQLAPAEVGLGCGENTECEMDELCLFDRALSVDEVARLGSRLPGVPTGPATAPPLAAAPPASPADFPGLLLHLPFDDTDGRQVTDAAGRKPVGRIAGTAELVDGVRGRALRLTSTGRPARVNATLLNLADQADRLRLGPKDPFTIGVWVRGRPECIVWVRSPRPMKGFNSDDRIEMSFTGNAVTGYLRSSVSFPPGLMGQRPDTDWLHVAMTRDGDATLRLYLNGVAVPHAKDPVSPIALNPTEFGLLIYGGQGQTYDLDEFCLYNRALTADELRRLGTRPAGPPA